MTKFDFVAVSPDGLVATGSRRGDTVGEVELGLYEAKFRDIRVTEQQGPGLDPDQALSG